MLVSRTAASLNLRIHLRDDDDDPLPNIAFNNADLVVRYRRPTDTAWQTITLVAGTAGSYTERGWIGIGGGWHELGLPDAAIVPGERTDLEVTYATNKPQADAVDAVLGLSTAETTAIATAVGNNIRTASYTLLINRDMLNSGELRVTQRDDYAAADGRAYEVLVEKEGVDFTAATVVAGAGAEPGVPVIVPTASLHDKTVGSCVLRLEFTSSSLNVQSGRYNWDAHIVLGGRRNTVISGTVIVEPKYADAPSS